MMNLLSLRVWRIESLKSTVNSLMSRLISSACLARWLMGHKGTLVSVSKVSMIAYLEGLALNFQVPSCGKTSWQLKSCYLISVTTSWQQFNQFMSVSHGMKAHNKRYS
ncbi:hypothetical protein [Pseudoalteromonas obscura]|uniref:Uncharacterized protein n=1 Tax=Pseudoalteromonas obscura TaxID=3048491 RepID=A0ABT7EP66_9GAMM|nr:hypothetical protein [Pseudoalteromonas sp. P94(2023)]MDK2596851.1 hypothetical protein [Pseudoalteromonas sp. P94(2023)]